MDTNNILTSEVFQRYLKFVQFTPTCWLWTGGSNGTAYGVMHINGKTYLAHRLAHGFASGEMPPKGINACHHCDTPRCVRPDHLFLGTQMENLADCKRKGRIGKHQRARGEDSGNSKLTAEQVKSIRIEFASGATKRGLGRKYSVLHGTICQIINRSTWRHVP